MSPSEVRRIKKRIKKCVRRIAAGKDVQEEGERMARLARILQEKGEA